MQQHHQLQGGVQEGCNEDAEVKDPEARVGQAVPRWYASPLSKESLSGMSSQAERREAIGPDAVGPHSEQQRSWLVDSPLTCLHTTSAAVSPCSEVEAQSSSACTGRYGMGRNTIDWRGWYRNHPKRSAFSDDAGLSRAIINFREARLKWSQCQQERYRDLSFITMETHADVGTLHASIHELTVTVNELQDKLKLLIDLQVQQHRLEAMRK